MSKRRRGRGRRNRRRRKETSKKQVTYWGFTFSLFISIFNCDVFSFSLIRADSNWFLFVTETSNFFCQSSSTCNAEHRILSGYSQDIMSILCSCNRLTCSASLTDACSDFHLLSLSSSISLYKIKINLNRDLFLTYFMPKCSSGMTMGASDWNWRLQLSLCLPVFSNASNCACDNHVIQSIHVHGVML